MSFKYDDQYLGLFFSRHELRNSFLMILVLALLKVIILYEGQCISYSLEEYMFSGIYL